MKPMKPEQRRHEQFVRYAEQVRRNFQQGMLAELHVLPQWVVWKRELDKDGKQKKAPYNPHLKNTYASVKAPASWGTLESALTALASGNYSGIGFMITPPLVFIDLDHCVSKESGEIIDPKAKEIVQQVNSYTELSPSRTGLHILAKGAMPGGNIHTAIEMYGKDRFTTITTLHMKETPLTIEQRQGEIEHLYHQFAPHRDERQTQNTRGGESGSSLSELPKEAANDQLLQQLLQGDISSCGNDPSRADFVLIMKLLHWTGDDIALTRKLFLASGLYREEKTLRKTGTTTYLDMTIHNALIKRQNPPQRR